MMEFPVTRSTLSAKELGAFIKDQYRLSADFTCELFRTGINHTYFISSSGTKYVIRVYSHNWRSKSEIIEELNLLNFLKENNLSVSVPVRDKNGSFIQEINAPEGTRYVVLFSFATGDKIRFMDTETCFSIGSFMAKIHKLTLDKTIERTAYNKQSLVENPYEYLKPYFPEKLPEMEFIKTFGESFQDSDFENVRNGVVHMDIWYDNMAVEKVTEVTIFDFDFCGNGWQVLDIAYFCMQLFCIESDKNEYELKVQSFLTGYQKVGGLSKQELKLIPKAGAAVFVFYLGVQAVRFDWSNIFLTENYLKMFVGRIKAWIDYYKMREITMQTS